MIPTRRNNNLNWLPSIFNDFFDNNRIGMVNTTAPAINVVENEQSYKVEVAAPGMNKEDFKIQLTEENELVINMEKKDEKKEEDDRHGKYLRHEFSYSKFEQSFVLPKNVERENITACMNDGVLTIDLPKQAIEEKKQNSRLIDIK